jgi:hypothetical protein
MTVIQGLGQSRGRGHEWWKIVLAVVIGGFLAYGLFLLVVQFLQSLIPIIMIVGVLALIGKAVRKHK